MSDLEGEEDNEMSVAAAQLRIFAEGGVLAKTGWLAWQAHYVRDLAPEQLEAFKQAFMCGAVHVFSSLTLLTHFSDADDVSELLDLIDTELAEYGMAWRDKVHGQ